MGFYYITLVEKEVLCMEEINLKEIGNYFLSHIVFILVVISVVFVCGCLYSSVIKKPLYHGTTSIVLATQNATTSITNTDIQINKNLVETYSEIIKSRKVLSSVINQLNLEYDENTLAGKVTVNAVSDTEIIKVTVSDANNESAKKIANKIADVFIEEVKHIYNLQNVSVLDAAIVETVPYNINLLKEIILYFLIGVFLAIGILFVIYYFDTSIKSTEDIEEKLGLTVLGSVPYIEKKGVLK